MVDYGSTNSVRIIKDVTVHMAAQNFREGELTSRAPIQKEMLKALIKARREKFAITLDATKGHYTGLGSIIYLNVDEEIKGPHRLVSKNINFSKLSEYEYEDNTQGKQELACTGDKCDI